MAAVELYKQDGDYFQGVNKASCGYKLLAAMGWQEGEGLGAQKQGIKTHVKVKKKVDNAGVGKARAHAPTSTPTPNHHAQSEADARTRDWTLGMVAYERLLSNLTEITSTQQQSTSEAASDASGGAGSSSTSEQQADASSSSSEEEVAPRRRVTHRGRFKKREASKAVSAYSCEDLTAIIGATASIVGVEVEAPQQAAPPPGKSKKRKQGRGDSHGSGEAAAKAATQTDTKAAQQAAEEAQARAASDAKSWWSGYFCRAGRTGAAGRRAPSLKVGFSEDDQVALYNLNKEHERCGRQGLGVRGMQPKVAGARWKGTKTKLGSDSEEEQQDVEEVEEEAQEQGVDGVVIIMPRGKGAVQPKVVQPKWRKITTGVLQKHGGVLSMKKLRARVLRLAVERGARGDDSVLGDAWRAVVVRSSKFVIDGRTVRLR